MKRHYLLDNFLASLVLFLIAIPLNLGIALASGVSVTAGLLAGVIGGLVVATLAGCPLMVSGPATGLIAIVWQIVERHGLSSLGVVVLGAGVLQILIGVLRLGPWFRAVSPAVIQGMLAGIGVLIFASQFHVMLRSQPTDSGWKNLSTLPSVLFSTLTTGDTASLASAGIGFLTIAVIATWPLWGKKFGSIPGSLPAVALAVAVAWALDLPVRYIDLPDSLLSQLTPLSLAEFQRLETLLCGARSLLSPSSRQRRLF